MPAGTLQTGSGPPHQPCPSCHPVPSHALGPGPILTRIMCPVEMSMLAWAGSSHQDGVLLWELGLAWAASLNWEDTLLTREGSDGPSARLNRDFVAMCWRHRSCKGRIRQGPSVPEAFATGS